jgi:FO synthase
MSHPADSALAKAATGERLSSSEAYSLTQLESSSQQDRLLRVAGSLRDRGHGHTITYSPKVFLPVTNLCRDRCTYCTFRRDPDEPGAWTMTPTEIADWSRRGRRLGCVEALMCLGDKPEVAFRGFKDFLNSHGVDSTAAYVAKACRIALEHGLLPHTNAGLLSKDEMAMLRPFNVSMGLMLENISPRLRDRGMPHQWAPDKEPEARLGMIAEAGELKIPFTTGILAGIGENEAERIGSLLAIRRLHERYGHIQEVIVQNFLPKDSTPMADQDGFGTDAMVRLVAMARVIMGADMNLQAPPNLSPGGHSRLIQAGINDWGGISPLTMDYVNPEAPWPHIDSLAETCRQAGYDLEPRLPVYADYINDQFQDQAMLDVLAARNGDGVEEVATAL